MLGTDSSRADEAVIEMTRPKRTSPLPTLLRRSGRWVAFALVTFVVLPAAVVLPASTADPLENFKSQIRPVLQEHCFKCHNGEKQLGGIDLTPFDSDIAVL